MKPEASRIVESGALGRLLSRYHLRSTCLAVVVFLGLGTLTALWANPWFMRMTPVRMSDYLLLGAQAVLLGLFLGLRVPGCTLRSAVKGASVGSVLTFLGFGCALCNQVLLLIFSATALTAVFEPVQPIVGLLGVGVLLWALQLRLRERARLL